MRAYLEEYSGPTDYIEVEAGTAKTLVKRQHSMQYMLRGTSNASLEPGEVTVTPETVNERLELDQIIQGWEKNRAKVSRELYLDTIEFNTTPALIGPLRNE